MNIADRIITLRKSKGISQEELANHIGVSRQAVSKWESEQSIPDVDKIVLLSDYFDVTTDYLLKGIEMTKDHTKKIDARILSLIGSIMNFIGLVLAIGIWIEKQTNVSVIVGVILMSLGCMVHMIGQWIGKNKEISSHCFWIINIWFLTLIPISCLFNILQGIVGGYYWLLSPIPLLGNSLFVYILCWISYILLCCFVGYILKKKR